MVMSPQVSWLFFKAVRKVGNQISGERTTCLKVMSQEQQPSPMRGEDVDMPTRLFRPGAPRTRFLLLRRYAATPIRRYGSAGLLRPTDA